MNCKNCGEYANKVCADCKMTRYCGVKCQTADWHNNHEFTCEARLYLKDLKQDTRDAKNKAQNSILIPIMYLQGTINFNVMILPVKKDDKDDEGSDGGEGSDSGEGSGGGGDGGKDPFEINTDDDDDFMGDDDHISLYTDDKKFLELSKKMHENSEGTLELSESEERQLEREYEKRKETLRNQKRTIDYLTDEYTDYYIDEEAFKGGKRNFYLIVKTPGPYQIILNVLKRTNNKSGSTNNGGSNNNNNASTHDDSDFDNRVVSQITKFVKAKFEDIQYDDLVNGGSNSSNTMDTSNEPEPNQYSMDTSNEPEPNRYSNNNSNSSNTVNDSTILDEPKKLRDEEPVIKTKGKKGNKTGEEGLMKNVNYPKIFASLLNPTCSTFLTRNNLRYSAVNVHLLLKQLIKQNGKNSLVNAGSIRQFNEWKKMGFSVRGGQKILKTRAKISNNGGLEKFIFTNVGFDESQLASANPKLAREAFKKRTEKVEEEQKTKFISFVNVGPRALINRFKEADTKYEDFPVGVADKITEYGKIATVLENGVGGREHHSMANLKILQFNFSNSSDNLLRIIFHLIAHFILDHGQKITEEQEIEAEAVAILTCNMIGITGLPGKKNYDEYSEYHQLFIETIKNDDKIGGKNKHKQIIQASKDIILFASNARKKGK